MLSYECCTLQADLKRVQYINVALIRLVSTCFLPVLGLLPKKKSLFFLFFSTESPPTTRWNHESVSGSGQWPGYINHTYKVALSFLAHRLSRLSWDADEKVIQEVGAPSEAEHRVGQLEGKVGWLAQLASCGARTGQDKTSAVTFSI